MSHGRLSELILNTGMTQKTDKVNKKELVFISTLQMYISTYTDHSPQGHRALYPRGFVGFPPTMGLTTLVWTRITLEVGRKNNQIGKERKMCSFRI